MQKLARLLLLRAAVAAGLGGLPPAAAHAQAPTWQMAVSIGTPADTATGVNVTRRWIYDRCGGGEPAVSYSQVEVTAADSSGNVYLAGSFTDFVTFGTTTLSSGDVGRNNLYVAKWNPATGFVWAKKIVGFGRVGGLAARGGSVYVAGSFDGNTISFDTTTLTNASARNSAITSDGFVAKLTDAGRTSAWTWVRQLGGIYGDGVRSLAVRGSNVYVAGGFWSTTSIGTTTLSNAGDIDGFVAKLTDAGSTSAWTWVRQVGETGIDQVTSLAASGSSVYVAGNFRGPTIRFGATTLTNAGDSDGFVAMLTDVDSTSAWTWAQQIGGTAYESTNALAVRGGNVYVAGCFRDSTIRFGATKLTLSGYARRTLSSYTARTQSDTYDGFVAKLTDAGRTSSWTWVQPIGSIYYGSPDALAVRGSSVYVAGNFRGPAVSFGTTTLTNDSTGAGFVAKLTDAGATSAWTWAKPVGGKGWDCALALAVSRGRVYVGGFFDNRNLRSTITFGAKTLTANDDTTTGFLAALADRPPPKR